MSKFTIYQVFPRLFGNEKTTNKISGTINENGCGKFNDFNTKTLSEIKLLGITHIWYTGIIEHATQTDYSSYGILKDHKAVVKGIAGSPYAIKDYYDVDPDLAVNVENRMTEFHDLVKRTHEADMKVIIDFVPNHVAREYHSDSKPQGTVDLGETDNSNWAFSPLNNFYYIPGQSFSPQFNIDDYNEFPAKATGNDQFTASPTVNDWYETVKLNYGVNYMEGGQKQFDPIPDTWTKMLDILLFWANKKVDGFRCDMAEMVPVEFWNFAIAKVKEQFPEIIFIAEVYNPNEYRNFLFTGKFDYLYDKVGLYDKLKDISTNNHSASDITHCWQALSGIEDRMLNFLENHDEQRIASTFFMGNAEHAIPAMIISSTLTKAPVMLYSGQELGEKGMSSEGFSGHDGRTTIFDYWGIHSLQNWRNNGKYDTAKLNPKQKALRKFYANLLHICLNEKAISEGLLYDLEYVNFGNPQFDTNKQFAYFRKYEDDLLLILVNFSEEYKDAVLNIPVEALCFLEIDVNASYNVVNLLDETEKMSAYSFNTSYTFATQIQAKSGQIYKFSKL